MVIDVPLLPSPLLDVAQDDEGYSAELSVERELSAGEYDIVSAACLRVVPVVRMDGDHEIRGLVSVDDERLWVSVHEVGPGPFGTARHDAAQDLLVQLWESVHEAAACA